MAKVKIKMIADRNGYPAAGEVLDVDEERAERWVLDKGIAEFAERKDKQNVIRKIKEREKAIEEADKRLGKELDALDKLGE